MSAAMRRITFWLCALTLLAAFGLAVLILVGLTRMYA
jgi:hypothetical protein